MYKVILSNSETQINVYDLVEVLRPQMIKIHLLFDFFSVFDTVSIGGIFTGQTVLARIAKELGFEYENDLAHSASYDSEITAKVFCKILNKID